MGWSFLDNMRWKSYLKKTNEEHFRIEGSIKRASQLMESGSMSGYEAYQKFLEGARSSSSTTQTLREIQYSRLSDAYKKEIVLTALEFGGDYSGWGDIFRNLVMEIATSLPVNMNEEILLAAIKMSTHKNFKTAFLEKTCVSDNVVNWVATFPKDMQRNIWNKILPYTGPMKEASQLVSNEEKKVCLLNNISSMNEKAVMDMASELPDNERYELAANLILNSSEIFTRKWGLNIISTTSRGITQNLIKQMASNYRWDLKLNAEILQSGILSVSDFKSAAKNACACLPQLNFTDPNLEQVVKIANAALDMAEGKLPDTERLELMRAATRLSGYSDNEWDGSTDRLVKSAIYMARSISEPNRTNFLLDVMANCGRTAVYEVMNIGTRWDSKFASNNKSAIKSAMKRFPPTVSDSVPSDILMQHRFTQELGQKKFRDIGGEGSGLPG